MSNNLEGTGCSITLLVERGAQPRAMIVVRLLQVTEYVRYEQRVGCSTEFMTEQLPGCQEGVEVFSVSGAVSVEEGGRRDKVNCGSKFRLG